MEQRPDPEQPQKAEPEISKAIKALLDRHGVPNAKRTAALETVLGVKALSVRRRMSGEVPWDTDEIRRLADHFHVPLFELLAALVDEPGQAAVLQFAGSSVPCQVWFDAESAGGFLGTLVAVQVDASWVVLPLADAGDRRIHGVRRLLVEAQPVRRRRVAVLEDDESLASTLVRFFRSQGLDATAYGRKEQLRSALESSTFDGYVVDWLLGDSDAADVLPVIRGKSPQAPVVILTGNINSERPEEDEMQVVIRACRALLFEKPTKPLLLLNALELGFAAAAREAR